MWSSGVGSIRIDEMGDSVLRVPPDNGLMKEGSVPVSPNCPLFLGTLNVVSLFFS
jgi:hypothetical protein